jgi:hypothetical protein
MANEWAELRKRPPPEKLSDLCNTVFKNFDREELRKEYDLKNGAKEELKLIRETLQVRSGLDSNYEKRQRMTSCVYMHACMQVEAVVNSYALSKLTTQYHEGTRLWMFEKVNAWLKAG